MRQLEQEYSEHAEGESDLKRMCQSGESCRNQVGKSIHPPGAVAGIRLIVVATMRIG